MTRPGWVYGLEGKEVVITGDHDDFSREALTEIAEELGARRVHNRVGKRTTDVLVRCSYSDTWKHGDFGRNEARAAEMQLSGASIVMIDVAGLMALRSGLAAPALTPQSPLVSARQVATAGGQAGAPYRAADPDAAVAGSGDVFRDPENVQRGLRGHRQTQNELAEMAEQIGYEPLAPFNVDCNFDLAWHDDSDRLRVVEVKSLTADNAGWQIRHGLGQVLDYSYRLELQGFNSSPVLALECEPASSSYWHALCARHDVLLTWAPGFPGVFR